MLVRLAAEPLVTEDSRRVPQVIFAVKIYQAAIFKLDPQSGWEAQAVGSWWNFVEVVWTASRSKSTGKASTESRQGSTTHMFSLFSAHSLSPQIQALHRKR